MGFLQVLLNQVKALVFEIIRLFSLNYLWNHDKSTNIEHLRNCTVHEDITFWKLSIIFKKKILTKMKKCLSFHNSIKRLCQLEKEAENSFGEALTSKLNQSAVWCSFKQDFISDHFRMRIFQTQHWTLTDDALTIMKNWIISRVTSAFYRQLAVWFFLTQWYVFI